MAQNGRKRKNQFSQVDQPPNEAKRVPKRATRIKEAIGLDSWDNLQAYLTGEGVEKFIRELHAMDGKDFSINYLAAVEYFKPKLARTELTGEINAQITEIRRTVISKKV